MQKVMDKYGKIDILVNNAGILEQGLKPIDRFLDEDMDRIIETNEKGTMRCMKAASKRMKSGASIVNVASVAGEKGCGGAAYVASKAAVIGLTKHTALRFQKDGIRCNAICPGNIITPMTMGTDPAALDPDMIGAMMNHSDIKAPSCTAEDVANVIVQDIFISLYEKSEILNYDLSLKSYLFNSVRNRCFNYLRDRKVEDRRMNLYAEACLWSDNVDWIEEEEVLRKIQEVMLELPEKCREVCRRRFFEGKKFEEIAEELDISESTARVQTHRGMEMLRQRFAEYDLAVILFFIPFL